MLPKIRIEIIKNDHHFYYLQSVNLQFYYACFINGEYKLRLDLESGSCSSSRLFYKNVELNAYGLNASRWTLHICDSSHESIKNLSNESKYFEFYDQTKSDSNYNKIWKSGFDDEFKKNDIEFDNYVNSDKKILDELELFNNCVAENITIYNLIEDKQSLKNMLLDYEVLEGLLWWNHLEGNDYDEYNLNFKAGVETFVKNSSEYFQSFYDSEHCVELLKSELTIQSVKAKYNDIELVIEDYKLQYLIDDFVNNFKNNADKYKSIIFDKKLFLDDIIEEFFNLNIEQICIARLKEKYTREKFEDIYREEIAKVDDRDDLLNELEKYVARRELSDESILLKELNDFLNKYLAYDDFFKKFYRVFGSNCKIIDLTDDKEKRFIAYENGEISLESEEINEYDLAYKIVKPNYINYFYLKNGRTLKPSIKRVPLYFEFVKYFFNCLIKNNIIEEKDGMLDFRIVENIKLLEMADYEPSEFNSQRVKRILLESLTENPNISIKELEKRTMYSESVLYKFLNELSEKGFIEKITNGIGRKCSYKVIEKNLKNNKIIHF